MSSYPLARALAYRCKDDTNENCRMSCREFMRGECDGRSAMIDADGSWYRNEILRRKGGEQKKVKVNITIDPGDLPDGVKFVG